MKFVSGHSTSCNIALRWLSDKYEILNDVKMCRENVYQETVLTMIPRSSQGHQNFKKISKDSFCKMLKNKKSSENTAEENSFEW